MKKIVVIGEILVEIMADSPGQGFLATQPLTGPYPSGAPAIFADQVARFGQPVGIISCVGDDDFGRINTERLASDGVDISAVLVRPDWPTGSAFVRYRTDGSNRDFVFNIKHSACGVLPETDAANKLISSADHLHIMGSSLSSEQFIKANIDSAESIKSRGGSVSFDPNIRKELLSNKGLHEAMQTLLGFTDLFLPSGDELTLLSEADNDQEAIQSLLGSGIKAIVHKQGKLGAIYHDTSQTVSSDAYSVEEIDPTGAGDCFGGAFTALWLRGTPVKEALNVATAAGALAVTQRGPMEGATDLARVREFIANHD